VGSSRIKLGSATGILGSVGGRGAPSCSDVLATGFLRAIVFFRVVAFLATGFLRAAVFLRVVVFLAAGFLRAAVFLRVVVFLAAGFLRAAGLRSVTAVFRAAVFLRVALFVLPLLAGIAITFLIVGISPFIPSRRGEVPRKEKDRGFPLWVRLAHGTLRWVVAFLRGIGRPWREITNESEATPAIW
jgi:hypothetical protein